MNKNRTSINLLKQRRCDIIQTNTTSYFFIEDINIKKIFVHGGAENYPEVHQRIVKRLNIVGGWG